MKSLYSAFCFLLAFSLINSANSSERKVAKPKKAKSTTTAGKVVDDAKNVKPLGVGAITPDVTIYSTENKTVSLQKLVKEKPTVLVFYRGGWCPYCNKHLAALSSADAELKKLGFQIVALSIDNPEFVKKASTDKNYNYNIYSDYKAEAAKAFGLAFKVDAATVSKYKNNYKIDLEKFSGKDHHILPVPAVYLIDTQGKIQFSHHDANYKKRLNNKVLLEKAKSLKPASKGSSKKTGSLIKIKSDHNPRVVSISDWDPELPGFHLSSKTGIGRVKISAIEPGIENLTLIFPKNRYEGFILKNDNLTVQGRLPGNKFSTRKKNEKSTLNQTDYFDSQIVNEKMQVKFLPKALTMLEEECTLTWIDAYRK